jgi:glycosyltransferase involved in cell wall biosynthesis
MLPPNPERALEIGRRLSDNEPRANDQPTVSVITVVYNNAATLQRCIDSVVAQTGVVVEYIVIDGGSTDGTVDVIKANAAHIDYAVSEPDRGIYDAMNKGISLAQSDYIALINSDDWLEPEGLKVSVDNMLANNAEVSIGFANVWDKHGEFSHVWKIGNFDARILTSGMSFCHQALIASRKAYETVGPFDATIRISADYKWIKRLYLSGLKAVFTEVPVVNFSFDGLAANNRPIWKQECKDLLTEQFPFLAPEDVSAFLEYVYRDAPLDQNAVENLLMHAGASPLLLQSLGLVLLDRLFARELEKKNIVSAANRVALTPPQRGALSLDQAPARPSPKISVVVPVYNVEQFLEACLRSVMEQSLRDIEIICVNDGSPDNSQAILERLPAEDPRIRIIVKENGGLSSARNAGIRVATGEYVHMLDSDDYIQPGMYEALYGHAKKHNLDLVKSNLGFIDDVYPVKRPALPKFTVFTFADCPTSAQFITPCGALYARALLERTELFPEGMTYEDRSFNWETLIEAERIGHVDETFYMYRVERPGSIMSSRKGNLRHFDGFRAIDKIRAILEMRGLLETFKVEYVKEQLRVYSMLIDIDAIPRPAYGRFFWEMRDRINADRVPMQEIQKAPMPPRVKALYAFLASGEPRDALALEGEKYFFHGVDYAKTALTHAGSSCELFLVAEHAIEHRFPQRPDDDGQRLRKAVALSLLFDSIHFGALDTVDAVVAALAKVADITGSADFDAMMSALRDTPPPATAPRAVRHLAFRYSQACNYRDCERFLAAYGAARDKDIVFFNADQVNEMMAPPAIASPRHKIIEQRTLGG